MSITRSEQIRQLAYKCAVLAIQAADRITKARFEQEEQDWLSLAEKAEKAEQASVRPWGGLTSDWK